jgi:hypothetical protein
LLTDAVILLLDAPTLPYREAAQANPAHNRQRTPNDAQRRKSNDEPDKLGRVRNAENPASKLDGGESDESKPNGAGSEHIAKEPEPGVLECARGGDDRGEWKRRWREAGNDQWNGRSVAHFFLFLFVTFVAHNFF